MGSVIDLTPTTGAGSSVTLGDTASAASNIFAQFNLGVVATPANVSVIIDDATSTQAAGTYNFYSTLGDITGPGGASGGINFTSFGPVNSYLLEGGPAGNTFDIHSTFNTITTSTTIVGGAGDDTANVLGDTSPGIGTPLSIDLGGGTNTVHVGNGNVASTISAGVTVNDTGGTTTLNLDDTLDDASTSATITSTTVNVGIAGTITYGAGVTALNINGGSGGNTFIVNNTSGSATTDLNTGIGADTVNVFATGTNTLNIDGQDGADVVTVGGLAGIGMQDLTGIISVTNDVGFTALTLDDSEDTTGQTATITDNGTSGSVTGLSPANINYTDSALSSLTINGGSGGNTFTVDGTLTNPFVPSPTVTTLNKGSGSSNSVDVTATNAGSLLNLTGTGGPDAVTITGNPNTLLGMVNINESPGSTNLVVDLSNDGLAHTLDLSSDGTTSTLTDELGNLPNPITYITASLASLTIDTDGAEDQILNLNFGGGGNPIPTGSSPGLIYNAGGNGQPTSQALNIFGELPSALSQVRPTTRMIPPSPLSASTAPSSSPTRPELPRVSGTPASSR